MSATSSAFQFIIARLLILTDEVLKIFVSVGVTSTSNISGCGNLANFNGSLTTCGTSLVSQLGNLVIQGVGLINGTIAALSVNTVNVT